MTPLYRVRAIDLIRTRQRKIHSRTAAFFQRRAGFATARTPRQASRARKAAPSSPALSPDREFASYRTRSCIGSFVISPRRRSLPATVGARAPCARRRGALKAASWARVERSIPAPTERLDNDRKTACRSSARQRGQSAFAKEGGRARTSVASLARQSAPPQSAAASARRRWRLGISGVTSAKFPAARRGSNENGREPEKLARFSNGLTGSN